MEHFGLFASLLVFIGLLVALTIRLVNRSNPPTPKQTNPLSSQVDAPSVEKWEFREIPDLLLDRLRETAKNEHANLGVAKEICDSLEFWEYQLAKIPSPGSNATGPHTRAELARKLLAHWEKLVSEKGREYEYAVRLNQNGRLSVSGTLRGGWSRYYEVEVTRLGDDVYAARIRSSSNSSDDDLDFDRDF